MSTSKWIVQCPIIIELSDGIKGIKEEQECNLISKSKKKMSGPSPTIDTSIRQLPFKITSG